MRTEPLAPQILQKVFITMASHQDGVLLPWIYHNKLAIVTGSAQNKDILIPRNDMAHIN